MIKYAHEINNVALKLINNHTDLNDLTSEDKIKELPEEEYSEVVIKIFKKLLRLNKQVDICNVIGYWIIHDINSVIFR